MFADQLPVHEWRASSSMRLERQQRSLSCWEESRTHSKCDGNHEQGRCFGRSILAAVGEAGDPKRIITEGREVGGAAAVVPGRGDGGGIRCTYASEGDMLLSWRQS